MQKRQFMEMLMNILWGNMIINWKSKRQVVNNKVSSASEAQNLEVEEVIMCCLVSAATHQREQWYESTEKCWIHEQTEKTEETWRKICFNACSFTMNPTQSYAKLNCSYTVRRWHQTTWHHDSTIFTEMCTAKLYGHSIDTALSIDTRTNKKYWKERHK